MLPSSAVRFYSASGWSELGQTDGWGRHRRDYYVKHDQPKRLFCRQLFKNARRSLQAEHLKPALAVVEQKVSSCNGVDTSGAQTMSPQPISNPRCPKTTTVRHSA
jgi:hypothetical protein